VSEPQTSRAWQANLIFGVAALLVYVVHLLVLRHFLPVELALGDEAISGGDFSTHLAQTKRVLEGIDGWGRTWVYDVQLLAGFPNGTIFDADNKGWELWTWLGMRLGLPFEQAANSFLVAAHLLGPPVVFVGARLFRVDRWPALAAAALASSFWFFDSFTHWCWFIGMVEYAFASYLCLIPLGLFYRFVTEQRVWQAIASALVLGATLIMHPYVFVILCAPMVWLWLRNRRELSRRSHALIVGIAVTAIVMNLWWLLVAFRFWHHIMDSAYFGQAGLSFVLADLFSTLLDSETSGLTGTRTGFRLLVVVASAIQLRRWWQRDDMRGGLFAVTLATLLLLTYVGGYLDVIAQIQPYRFVVPTGFLATVPAGVLFVEIVAELRSGEIDRKGKVLALVLAVPAFQHLADDILYFMPDLQPPPPRLFNGEPPMFAGSGYAPHATFRHANSEGDPKLIEWIRKREDGRGRWLVEWPPLADEISWKTNAQVVGGLPFLNLEHSWANLYRRHPHGVVEPDELRAYLETYAVSWVVVSFPNAWFNREPNPWLDEVAIIGGHHIYRTKLAVNLVAEGGGKVKAQTNRIRVTGSKPDVDSVLRYHWMDTLVCRPDCTIERVEIDGVDPIGFIRVPAPHPADYEIVNGY
jgi:hypothetical protein